MRIYWTLKSIPELAALPPRERSRVHRACYRKYGLKGRRPKLALLACGLCAGAGSAIGSLLYAASQPAPFASLMVLQAVCAGAGGGIGGFGFSQVVIRHLRPHYAEFLGEGVNGY